MMFISFANVRQVSAIRENIFPKKKNAINEPILCCTNCWSGVSFELTFVKTLKPFSAVLELLLFLIYIFRCLYKYSFLVNLTIDDVIRP